MIDQQTFKQNVQAVLIFFTQNLRSGAAIPVANANVPNVCDTSNALNSGANTYDNTAISPIHNYLLFPFKYVHSIEVSKANKHYFVGLPNQQLADKKDVMF